MIGHRLARLGGLDAEPAGVEQLGNEGRVVLDHVVAAEGAILATQHMEAVRVGGDDALEAVARQRGDIALGEALEGGLVTQSAGDVAAVALFVTQHGEVDLGGAQDLDQRAQGALVAHVEGAVAQPQQHIDSFRALLDTRDIEVRRPVQARGVVEPAGVVGGDQIVDRRGTLLWGLAPLQSDEAAHVDDGIHVLDHHRALFDTGAARGARPQRLRLDQLRHDGISWPTMVLADLDAGITGAGIAGVTAAGHAHDHVLDQLLGVERLAGGVGRADILAAAALDAGVETEQLLPLEIGGLLHAQRLRREIEREERGGAAATMHIVRHVAVLIVEPLGRRWKARWKVPAKACFIGPPQPMPISISARPQATSASRISASTPPPSTVGATPTSGRLTRNMPTE